MTTRIAVVTGATSGLGEAAAGALAKEGYQVVAVGRDPERGAAVVAAIAAAGGQAEFWPADLFRLAEVRALGRRILAAHPSIDLLVNNAGGSFQRFEKTADGLERTVALNVAAPWALTETLLPALAAAKGRVINIVTGVQKGVNASMDQLFGDKVAAGTFSYVRAKLALLAVTEEQQRRYGGQGVTFVALHPGVVPGTRFGSEMPAFLKAFLPWLAKVFHFGSDINDVAGLYLKLATGPVDPAGYYYEGKPRPMPVRAADTAFSGEVWGKLAALPA